jgi:hypothetical protein
MDNLPRYQHCEASGKRRFVTRSDAKLATKVTRHRVAVSKGERKRYREYLCDKCNGWHIATVKERKSMSVDRCKSCNAAIVWVKTPAGKSTCLDAEPSPVGTIQILPDATCVYLKKADAEKVRELNTLLVNKTPLHVSHFATCPNSAHHRKAQ